MFYWCPTNGIVRWKSNPDGGLHCVCHCNGAPRGRWKEIMNLHVTVSLILLLKVVSLDWINLSTYAKPKVESFFTFVMLIPEYPLRFARPKSGNIWWQLSSCFRHNLCGLPTEWLRPHCQLNLWKRKTFKPCCMCFCFYFVSWTFNVGVE